MLLLDILTLSWRGEVNLPPSKLAVIKRKNDILKIGCLKKTPLTPSPRQMPWESFYIYEALRKRLWCELVAIFQFVFPRCVRMHFQGRKYFKTPPPR